MCCRVSTICILDVRVAGCVAVCAAVSVAVCVAVFVAACLLQRIYTNKGGSGARC